ncbi:MAG TPA: hypothetical protein VFZ49_08725 [Pyrinomonadaceae bacterium]
MKYLDLRGIRLMLPLIALGACLFAAVEIDGQATRRRTSTPIPAPTATPSTSEPMIISRADEFPDENPQAIPPDPSTRPAVDAASLVTLEELGNRIKNLEAGRKVEKADPDEKQKRVLLNLDILTRAEQRSESLRKQVFEMIEKENAVKTKLDTLDYDLRPEVIERSTALIGSLRPEEIRASRRKSLEAERTNLQSLLTEIQKTRAVLDINLQRSDAMVEKLRLRFEKEIDAALAEDPEN